MNICEICVSRGQCKSSDPKREECQASMLGIRVEDASNAIVARDTRIKELERLLSGLTQWLPNLNFAQYPSDDEMRKQFMHKITKALKEG
jgi:hypothetical protein